MNGLNRRPYAPFPKPLTIPSALWNDTPLMCLEINDEWLSYLIGAINALDQQDVWIGNDDEIYAVRQQINEMLLAFQTPCARPSFNFLGDTVPTNVGVMDLDNVNLGTIEFFETDGQVIGLRFYKSAAQPVNLLGTLYTYAGVVIDNLVFPDTIDEGWIEGFFDTPVSVFAGDFYVASYWAEGGRYSTTPHFFETVQTLNGIVFPASSEVDVGNGRYAYVDEPDYPAASFNETLYFIEAIYVPE